VATIFVRRTAAFGKASSYGRCEIAMARETRSLTMRSSTRIVAMRGDTRSAVRRSTPTIHIVRTTCGEVFDNVGADVAETGHERVEQALGGPLNPHVEKPELRRIPDERTNCATRRLLIEIT
jgi:hypothetical protein